MKSILTKGLSLVLFIASSFNVFSQELAITISGDSIYVYPNGTWTYEALEDMPSLNELAYLDEDLEIDTISTEFIYSQASNKEVVNKNNQFKIKYNASDWKRIPPASINEEAEFAFSSKETDIWCLVISEEIPIDMEALFLTAKNNMEEFSGSKVEIIKTELRTVNGVELIRGVMRSEYSGIPLIFDTYYYSNDNVSVQFTVYTSDNLWEKNTDLIHELLNGFVVE